MKVLIAYMSQSGNTKKVAEAMFDAIQVEKEIKELSEIESVDGYDLLFVGFPIQAFGPAEKAKQFMAKYINGKNVALFTTHASPEDSEDLPPWLEACRKAAADAEIVGFFNCQGELSPDIMEMLKSSDHPKMKSFAEQGPSSKGQPDAARLARASAFAKEMTS
ncbi:MAG: flavodoxin [Chloroflexi bacterium]|jgi:flavodoxin|nr:flavodoxin [Chloroflexota bacterium]